MRFLPPPITDHLGHSVPVALVTRQALRVVKADPMRRPALRELKLEGESPGTALLLLLACLLCGMPLLRRMLNIPPGVAGWVELLLGVLVVVLIWWRLLPMLLGRSWSTHPERTRRRFLAALLCPSCTHDLKGVPPREDSVTVCPECGAAWKMEGTGEK